MSAREYNLARIIISRSQKNRNSFDKSIFYTRDVSDVFLQSIFKL